MSCEGMAGERGAVKKKRRRGDVGAVALAPCARRLAAFRHQRCPPKAPRPAPKKNTQHARNTDEVSAVVFDIGGSLCRAGYAGDDLPRAVYPSVREKERDRERESLA